MRVVQTEHGDYFPVADRLQRFLKAYPPTDGFGVKIVRQDVLALKPALLRLYDAAIAGGKPLSQSGLPPLPNAAAMIFEAFLVKTVISSTGEKIELTLASASTYQLIAFEKDYEIAETRARGRLLAALGFHPSLLDADEMVAERSAPAESTDSPREPSSTPSDPVDSATDAMAERVDPSSHSDSPSDEVSASTSLSSSLKKQANIARSVLAKLGIDREEPTTKKEALALIRESRSPQPASGAA
jgi:hypothetical protein